MALLLSAMQTFVRPRDLANSKAWRMIRCTPFQVFSSSWIAISSSRARLEAAADADVEPLGVLAEHDEIHVLRPAPLQRAEPLVQQLDGAVVREQVEFEARAEKDVTSVAVVGNARIPERADEHGVELAQVIVPVRRDGHTGLQVVIGAPGQVLHVERPPEAIARRRQHLHRFRGDFLSNSVAGDYRYAHLWSLSRDRR